MLTAHKLIASLAGATAILIGSPAVCADAPAPAASAHNLQLAKRLFTDMHIDQMMSGMLKTMAPALVEQQLKANPGVSRAQAEAITNAVEQSNERMMSKIMDRMIPLYASTFSEKELQDLVNFYEGPTGQAMLAKMPALTAKITPMVIEMLPEMQADMRQRLCAISDCTKLAPPAAPKA